MDNMVSADEQKKLNWKRILLIGFAGVGVGIGAGFATGQELLQFFSAFGVLDGILAVLLQAGLFIYVCLQYVQAGRDLEGDKVHSIFKYYGGKYLGTFFDWFSVIVTYSSAVLMISGAGATISQYLGIPIYVGASAMALLACITVLFGFHSIVETIGRITPVTVSLVIVVCIIGLIMGNKNLARRI